MTGSAAPASHSDVVLALDGITKRFGGTIALEDVSFALRRGTVHALLGENGAGKTTLMRIAFGLITADSGRVIADNAARIASPSDAIAAGLGMVHQHFTNVPAMTVAENVALGARGAYRADAAAERVRAIGSRTGLSLDPSVRVESLPVGAQQRLEIVKALAHDARVLILDEPTAVLAPAEARELLAWLRAFAGAGNAVVLITHKLRDALAIADDVTVLRRGRRVLSASTANVTEAQLATALLGEELSAAAVPALASQTSEIVAHARDVDVVDDRGVVVVRSASFDVRAGQIVGVAAVEGSGQRELLRAFARRMAIASGDLQLPDSIGFVPEDRHRDALVLDFTPGENVALRGAGVRRGRIAWNRFRERTAELVSGFDVRGATERHPVRTISGGNQQKLVLARELDDAPQLLVVENPTRGLDIRATQAVHERLRAAATSGAAVLLYSSDLDEVLALSTHLLVMYAGRVRDVGFDREAVGRAMLGIE
jgi:general nucleoside transport system ATP-binding protein